MTLAFIKSKCRFVQGKRGFKAYLDAQSSTLCITSETAASKYAQRDHVVLVKMVI